MKILHVVPSFGLGGMERVLCAIINALPGRCEQGVVSLTGEVSAKTWIQHPHVQFLPFSRPQGNIQYCLALLQVIRQWSPNLLMTYNWGATDAIWLGRLCGVPHVIHSEHGFNVDEATSMHWKRKAIRYVVYHCATKLVVVSGDLEHMMSDTFRVPHSRVEFIPNGIDTDFYSPNVYERDKIRDSLGFQSDDIVIGYAGRLDPVKNFPFMIQVVSHCVRRDQRFKLLLIGDGPDKEAIVQQCSELGISAHVVFVGRQENVLRYLQALDVFTLTSFREQMPMSMLEAMSVGVPVVASAVGEIPTILNGRQAGMVHDLREGPEVFAEAMYGLRDPQIRTQMGTNARNIVVTGFQEKLMLQRYVELLESTSGNGWSP